MSDRRDRCEPILPLRNLDETRAFYKKLGFFAWFDGREWPGYEIMSRGEIAIHFFLDDAGETKNAGCYWRCADARALYKECEELGLPAEGVPRLTPVCDQEWGMREFTFVDPHGNLIRVGQEL